MIRRIIRTAAAILSIIPIISGVYNVFVTGSSDWGSIIVGAFIDRGWTGKVASEVSTAKVQNEETAEKETIAETQLNVYELEITADNQILQVSDLKKLEIDAKTGDHLFNGSETLQKVSIPDSYTEIAYETFMNCSALTSVSLSEGLKEIGIQAFGAIEGHTLE